MYFKIDILVYLSYNFKKLAVNNKIHLLKAFSWNLLAMSITYIVLTWLPPFFDLKPISKEGAGILVLLDRFIKFISYYIHEKAWFSFN